MIQMGRPGKMATAGIPLEVFSSILLDSARVENLDAVQTVLEIIPGHQADRTRAWTKSKPVASWISLCGHLFQCCQSAIENGGRKAEILQDEPDPRGLSHPRWIAAAGSAST